MEHVTVLDLSFEGSRNQNVCNPGEIDCAKFREMNRNENSSGDSQPYWERIYHTLTTHSKIHTLILGGVQLGDSGVRQLFDALKENTSICLLDLFFNQITSVGLSTIVQVLTSNTSELLQQSSTQEVSAQRSFLPQVSYQLDDQNMSACLSIKNSEDCFNFTSSPRSVSDPVCIVLTNPPIRNLYLSWNEIDDEGMSSVSQLLRCNALLEEIDLSYCMITDLGGAELRDTLRGYTQCVPEIRLQGNTICSDLKSQIQGSARIMRQYGHGNVE